MVKFTAFKEDTEEIKGGQSMLYEVVYTKFTRDGITRYNEVLPREKIIRLLEDANIVHT